MFFDSKCEVKELVKIRDSFTCTSYGFCKRLLKKARNGAKNIKHVFTTKLFEFYETSPNSACENKYLIYVADENLAASLFEILEANTEIPTQFSSLIENMQIIACKKTKKVCFFVIDNNTRSASSSKSYYTHILIYFYDIVTKFCNLFSNENIKISIDYPKFFGAMISNTSYVGHNDFVKCLFFSTTLERKELSYIDLVSIIDLLLSGNKSWLDFNSIDHRIKTGSESYLKPCSDFCMFLNMGVYIKELDFFKLDIFPIFMYLNLFRLIIRPDYFTNLLHFFKPNIPYGKMFELSNRKGENFIFDEELFNSNLSNSTSTDDFIVHSTKFCNFLKLKSYSKLDYITSVLTPLNECGLIQKFILLYSLSKDEYYLCMEPNNFITLKSEMNKLGINDSQKVLDIIQTIYDKLSDLHYITSNVHLKKGVDILDCVSLSECPMRLNVGAFHGISFFDVLNFSFDKEEKSHTFNYALLIMRVIEYFLKNNSLEAKDIFSYEFAKLLPCKFIEEFNKYFSTGSCNMNLVLKSLSNFLNVEFLDNIIFLEDIKNNDDNLVKRLSFFNSVQENEKISKLLELRENLFEQLTPTIKGGSYIKFDDFLNKRPNLLTLNNSNIETLLKSNICNIGYLGIEKIIISKEFTNSKNYQIIGVVWNETELYDLYQLIRDGVLHIKSIYYIIEKLLLNSQELINKICKHDYNILVNDQLNVFINQNSKELVEIRKPKKLVNNYISLTSSFNKVNNSLEFFDYDDIVPNSSILDFDGQIKEFHGTISLLSFCKEHQCYYISRLHCPQCAKLYLFDLPVALPKTLYSDNVGEIVECSNHYIVSLPYIKYQKLLEQVKLGITNDLYSGFFGFEPEKILVKDCFNQKIFLGIAFDKFDFEGSIYSKQYKNVQRLKFILVLYRELLPHIQSSNFICSKEDIFNSIFMHSKFKGKIIIPNLYLLDCEAILNKDENLKASKKEETLKAFSNFLIKYLLEDDYFKGLKNSEDPSFLNIIKDMQSLNFDSSVIMHFMDNNNHYCAVHNVPFSKEEKLCPCCKADGISEENIIIADTSYFQNLSAISPKFDGGEANLYDYSDTEVQKIFKEETDLAFKSKILGKILQKAKLFEEFNQRHDEVKFVQVKKILYCNSDGNKNSLVLKGYVEQLVSNSFKISSLKDKEFVTNTGYNTRDIVEILIKVCTGIEFLHSIGGFIGDLNGGNILIKDKIVYFIDYDGMSFDDVRNCVYTNMYIYPPSAESNNITKLDDWYSLAIQAFYYLTYSHPFRGVCKRKDVPSNEIERMKLGLSVLGPHGIVAPSINIGWQHLPKELIQFFLDTFEGTRRENMINVLQLFLNSLPQNDLTFSKIQRNFEVSYSLTESTYIDSQLRLIYNEQPLIKIDKNNDTAIYDECIFFGCNNNTQVLNTKSGQLYTFNKCFEDFPLYVQDYRIFYTVNSGYTLKVDHLKADGSIDTQVIKRTTKNKVLSLKVNFANKFLFVEDNEESGQLDIYGNLTFICSIPKDSYDDITILYDRLSDKWLVLFSVEDFTNGIVIDKRQNCLKFTLDERISDSKQFYGNVLYYVTSGKICFYNINTKKTKFIVCNMVKEDSRIERTSNKFVISNKDSSWIYLKS